MKYDIIIQNGSVYDGLGNKPVRADVGIVEDAIANIGDLSQATSEKTIDVQGKMVMPGFIDILSHTDNYWTLFDYTNAESFLSQGITTVLGGNCGSSLAPLVSEESILSIQKWTDIRNVTVQWSTFGELLHFLDELVLPINFGSLVGHSTLRRGYLSDDVRAMKPSELESLTGLLKQSMSEGAFGFSTGLGYAHAEYASADEIGAFLDVVSEMGGLYAAHIRNEGEHLVQSVEEAIAMARDHNVRLEIAHFKAKGKKNWEHQKKALTIIRDAAKNGIDVSYNLYPYDFTLSVLYAYLPDWSYEGGLSHLLENIRGKMTRKKMIAEMKADGHDYATLVVAKADGLSAIIGKSFSEIARDQEQDVESSILDIIETSRARLLVFDRSLDPDQMKEGLVDPLSHIGTDDGYYDTETTQMRMELVHPRAYGCMTRYLKLVAETQKLSWEEAIAKITGRVAEKMRLENRGILREGKFADIVVLNPTELMSPADFTNPFQLSNGIDYVFVNGKSVYSGGSLTGQRSGRPLRFGTS